MRGGGVRLEDLTPGAVLRGVEPSGPVEVVQATWHGGDVLTLTFRTQQGHVRQELLYREDEPRLTLESPGPARAFDADPARFCLVSEARRISLAYLFDPYLAVTTSDLEPLPHQIQAVYQEMLPRQPLRFLLADDPGAGKTIMAGLLVKELVARGDVARALIVTPGSLVEQWQDELWAKFGLPFEIVTRDMIESSRSGNPFAERDLLIARLDQLARNDDVQARLAQCDFDIVVVDEAHKMAAHYFGNEVKETKRYRLGLLLGGVARHFLLITATPHSGKEDDFQLFLALLDADRFEGRRRDGAHTVDVTGLMRRLVKEKLYRFDGRRLFPERRAYSVGYALSDDEALLYKKVTEYVTEEMNRAERLANAGEGRRGSVVGFALTILQRRLASSPEAIYQSLRRRRKRLDDRLSEARLDRRVERLAPSLPPSAGSIDVEDVDNDLEDLPDEEAEALEEELVDQASAAQTVVELEAEISILGELEGLAARVRATGTDRKWEELAGLLQVEPEMLGADGARRKLIVFTEHRDTLDYLVRRLRGLLGRDDAVVAIHGGVRREERRKAQEFFTQDKDTTILVATDAAGEGVNLQRAHLMVNYDLPWNPNRIEQRFGRIHRIGQTEVCHLWNLVAVETREGQVFQRLFEKLDAQREALGDQVFDVLGESFTERSLRDLLIEAIRYGEDPLVRRRLDLVVDHAVGEGLAEVVAERALVSDVMSIADVERIRDEMEAAAARRLQPFYIRSFFLKAFGFLGGRIAEREKGRYEIAHVPADLRGRDREIGVGAPLLRRYERVAFDKAVLRPHGQAPAEFLCPGHPLLDVTVDILLERYGSLLKQGAILVDKTDSGETPRLLVYLEHAIQDARTDGLGNRRVVSKRFEFVEVSPGSEARWAGWAPHLDLWPPSEEEKPLVGDLAKAEWLAEGPEAAGLDYAIRVAVPAHLEEVRLRTVDRVERTIAAVRERLTTEIVYWDHRAATLKEQELAGKQPAMNPARAAQRRDDLKARMRRRLAELEEEQQLSPLPPVVVGAALVVPAGLLARLRGERVATPADFARERERVERLAVDAVLAAERAAGRVPEEMPHNNPGFDVRSKDPATGATWFLEVKGRVAGADSVTVTKNEILTGLNRPETFRLALVEVAPDDTTTVRYVEQPFRGTDDVYFDVKSVNYQWWELWERGREPSP